MSLRIRNGAADPAQRGAIACLPHGPGRGAGAGMWREGAKAGGGGEAGGGGRAMI